MKLSYLIPFRDADGTRTPAMEWIVARWRHHYPEAEFCIAPDDGVDPFNKALAVNNAAQQATGDIFLILDADTWVDEPHMQRALDLMQRGTPWVIPARSSYRLRREVSQRIMALPAEAPFPLIKRTDAETVGPVCGFLHIVRRGDFERVGGMDTRIRGWGGDDWSFTRAMDVVVGPHRKLGGTVYSLWHSRPRDSVGRTWLGQERSADKDKQALATQYRLARTPAAMLQLLGMQ